MSWLDPFLGGYATIMCGGVVLPQERVVNFVNATGADNLAVYPPRTDVTLGASSGVGGGAPSSVQSGAISLAPGTTTCIAVDLTSVDATINLDSVTAAAGLAFQFDTRGSKNMIFTSAKTIVSSQGPTQTTQTVNPQGDSVIAKYNATWGTWGLI